MVGIELPLTVPVAIRLPAWGDGGPVGGIASWIAIGRVSNRIAGALDSYWESERVRCWWVG